MKPLLACLCLACLSGCNLHEPVGVVLIYEIDPETDSSSANVPFDDVVTAVRKRLRSSAKVEPTGDHRIRVSVYGNDPTTVERLLSQLGSLQFRIVADAEFPEDERIIALAKEDQFKNETKITDVGTDGKRILVARWVPVVPFEVNNLQSGGHAIRENSNGETEVLVLIDKQNVTGAVLSSATAGTDESSQPCVHFRFNVDGAKRFGRLTSDNLPDPIDAQRARKLAIILDGRMHSTPIIRSRIDDQGQITGPFTKQEVERLADVLMAGELPVPVRKVSESTTAP